MTKTLITASVAALLAISPAARGRSPWPPRRRRLAWWWWWRTPVARERLARRWLGQRLARQPWQRLWVGLRLGPRSGCPGARWLANRPPTMPSRQSITRRDLTIHPSQPMPSHRFTTHRRHIRMRRVIRIGEVQDWA